MNTKKPTVAEPKSNKWDRIKAIIEKFLEVLGFGTGALILFLNFYLLVPIAWDSPYVSSSGKFDVDLASKFGDFFGGFIGTLGVLLSIALLYMTLRNQYRVLAIQQKAIDQQQKLIEGQEKDSRLRSFENNFYQLMNTHVDNINNLQARKFQFEAIPNYEELYKDIESQITGKDVFISLRRELETINNIVRRHYMSIGLKDTKYQYLTARASFSVFFLGTRSPLMRTLAKIAENDLKIEGLDKGREKEIQQEIKLFTKKYGGKFFGHQVLLGSYLQHIRRIILYVHKSEIDQKEKRVYVKILRDQLTTHELAILFFFSISPLCEPWEEKDNEGVEYNVLVKYNIFKHLPQAFCCKLDPSNFYEIREFVFNKFDTDTKKVRYSKERV